MLDVKYHIIKKTLRGREDIYKTIKEYKYG